MASRALGWSFLSTLLSRFGLMGFGIILARLLGPQQFGTAAVALVALLAILSFNELGVTLAIVRWPGEPSEILPTITTVSVTFSAILYVVLYVSAPSFSAAMGDPAATPVVRVLALSVLTNGVVGVSAALLERYFLQGRKLIADQVHGWLGVSVSVGLAFAGLGAMSLAIGQVLGAAVSGILIVIFAPLRLRLGFDLATARKLLRFGLPLAGSSLIVFLIANADNLITGHVLGATALGFYALAWNLASWPVTMFSQPVRSVAPALFSRLRGDRPAMRAAFVSVAALLGCVSLPVCFLISGSAGPLVGFVYGSAWAPAAQALRWLALLGALRILFELSYDYFVVLARSRVVVTVQLAWLLAMIPALTAGARLGGIGGVALAGVAVAACVVLPCYLVELSRVGIRVRALARRLWLPLLAGAGVGVIAEVAARSIRDDFLADVIGAVVALAAAGLLVLRMRPVIGELRHLLSRQAEPAGRVTGAAASAYRADRSQRADPGQQAAGLRALLAISTPVPQLPDVTEPLSACRDPVSAPSRHQEAAHDGSH
jgi:O-antigen/teichoic acid export membrane protein